MNADLQRLREAVEALRAHEIWGYDWYCDCDKGHPECPIGSEPARAIDRAEVLALIDQIIEAGAR